MNRNEITALIDNALRRFSNPLTQAELLLEINKRQKDELMTRHSLRRHLEHLEQELPAGYKIVRKPIEDADEQRRRGGRVMLCYNQLPPRLRFDANGEALLENIKVLYQAMSNLPWLPQVQQLMDDLNLGDRAESFMDDHPLCLQLDSNMWSIMDDNHRRHLGDLFDAALRGFTLDITYNRFNEEPRIHKGCSVQLLKQDNRFWYAAVVNDHSINREQPFFWLAVDRILKIRLSEASYQRIEFDWNLYFADIVGITNRIEQPVENICFLVYDEMRDYIKAAPLHRSQKYRKRYDLPGEPVEVSLCVKDNHELRNKLSSICKDIVILNPLSLANWHRDMMQKSLERIKTTDSFINGNYLKTE
ncbi:MAG: WYL domain-containing protein [Bacteroidales bacterium]|nr:WYL domain-containing protein [Bacteroidales bacterium]